MIAVMPGKTDSVLVRMVIASTIIHGLVLLGIGTWSSPFRTEEKREETIQRVKLVEQRVGPMTIQRLPPGPGPASESEPRQTDWFVAAEAVAEAIQEAPPSREIIREETLGKPGDTIAFAKKPKHISRIEEPKPVKKPAEPEPDPKPDVKPDPKKEDGNAVLEKRLAALRREVESRKPLTPAQPKQARPETPTSTTQSGAGGDPTGTDPVDREELLWLITLRGRINARWSVFTDQRNSQRMTVVGVKISDEGRLLHAVIDQSSGDETFDKSAMRAVFQADPFPPPPAHVKEKIQKSGGLALRFTPRGLQ